MNEQELFSLGVNPYDDSDYQLSFMPPRELHFSPVSVSTHRPLSKDEELTLMRLQRARPGTLTASTIKALRIRGNPMTLIKGLHDCGYPVKRNKDSSGEWYFWIEGTDA